MSRPWPARLILPCLLAGVPFVLVARTGAAPPPEGRRVTVVFVDRLTVVAPNGLGGISTRAALPQSSEEQTVLSLEVLPEPQAIVDEAEGREVALWEPPDDMECGDRLVVRWTCDAVLHPHRSGLPEDRVGTLSQVPQALADEYLADASLYALQSDAVRNASARAVRSPSSVPNLLAQLLGYVVSALEYESDGRWDSADVVLQRGTGSATEYAWSTIALCRLWGVPARYAGGIRCVQGDGFMVDRSWHRWVEAYIPGLGWRGLDPTRAERLGITPATLGGVPDSVLTVSVGGGSGESLIGQHYLSWHTWAGPDDGARVTRRGWSYSNVPDSVRARTAELTAMVANAVTPVQRVAALKMARDIGHPFALPAIEDLLYQSSIRGEAAEAMVAMGGSQAVVPLVDSLGQPKDTEGDAAVVRVLNQTTGAQLGPDPAAWQQWLRSDAGRSFLGVGQESD